MLKLTFDTNCLIDLAEDRPAAAEVWRIIEAHRAGLLRASFVAVSASERQLGDRYLSNYAEFEERLNSLGLGDIPKILGMSYWGISYWGHAIYASEEHKHREGQIHARLFPGIPQSFSDFALGVGIPENAVHLPEARKWRNAWCDRQMIWAHDFHGRDVFVTSDHNFRRLCNTPDFATLRIADPAEAANLIV